MVQRIRIISRITLLCLACLSFQFLHAQHFMIDADTEFSWLSKLDVQDASQKMKGQILNAVVRKKPREMLKDVNYLVTVLYFPRKVDVAEGNNVSMKTWLDKFPEGQDAFNANITNFKAYTPRNYIVDSVLYIKENGQSIALKGTVVIRVYLMKHYYQAVNLQTNNFIINIKAKKTKLTSENGIPKLVDKVMDCDYDDKIFLIDEVDGKYNFVKSGNICRECLYNDKPEEFTFDPLKGIVSYNGFLPVGPVTTDGRYNNSKQYYHFKPI